MKTNMGKLDRYLRALAVTIFLILVNLGLVTGTLKAVLGMMGIILITTALMGICPVYSLLGINTCPAKRIR